MKNRADLPFLIVIIPLLGPDIFASIKFFVPHLEINVKDASLARLIFIVVLDLQNIVVTLLLLGNFDVEASKALHNVLIMLFMHFRFVKRLFLF